jgi:micrococcal nuclease
VLLILLLLALLWHRIEFAQAPDYQRYHNTVCTCIKVVDGDTIDVNISDESKPLTRIRLWGVDTPETKDSPQGAMYFSKQSTEFTRSMVLNKKVRLVLLPERTRGYYGRLLAYVYLADTEIMLNEEIISQGYGYADRRFDHPWMQRFIKLEKRARKKEQGLWKEVEPQQYPDWRKRYEQWRKEKAATQRQS